MFMLISNNTKIYDIMNFMNSSHYEKINIDMIDNIHNLKKKYKYFEIDNIGNLIIAQKEDEIITNTKIINSYNLNENDIKKNFIVNIRKLKLKNIT